MDEQDKKPLDAGNMSDEELEELAGGVAGGWNLSAKEREQLRQWRADGGRAYDFLYRELPKMRSNQ